MATIILISHGAFCEGLLASLQMIAGGDYGVRAVPLIPGESPEAYREKLETVMREADDGSGSGTIVLSDIAGGTPFQSAAYLSKDFKLGLEYADAADACIGAQRRNNAGGACG